MKQNLLLIQPHSDDILFSASKFIHERKKYDQVIVLTIENDEKRLEEDKNLFDKFDIELLTLETDVSSKDFHKEYYKKYASLTDETAWDFCLSKIGEKKMKLLIEELDENLKIFIKNNFSIITCLGVGHPFHWLTTELTKEYATIFYRDFPHSYKKRNREYLESLLNSEFELKDTFDINKFDKFSLVKEFYKSQSSLLFFEQNYIKKMLPEEYYGKIKD